MGNRARVAAGIGLAYLLFLFVQLGAIALVGPFEAAGHQPVDDPQDPTNPVIYVLAILVATGLMLLAFRYGADSLIRVLIVGAGAWLSVYLFELVVPPLLTVGGRNVGAAVLAVSLGAALYLYPEWYVIDASGAIMGAVAAGLFGITFGILPALVLLVVLAVYDAISVYRTEHMLTLATGVMDLRVPVVLVIPTSAGYSFIDADFGEVDAEGVGAGDEESEAGEEATPANEERGEEDPQDEVTNSPEPAERDALFIGLGDAVIPAVLVASAAFFAPSEVSRLLGVPVPAVTAMAGTFVGLSVLLWMVLKGRAHAGLPLLNGGAIAGYLLGAVASGLTLVQALGLTPYL